MKNHHLHDLTRFVLTMFLFSPSLVAGQNADSSADTGAKPLFSSHAVLDIRIEAPLSQLMRERPDKDYLDGKLSYADAAGVAHTLDLKEFLGIACAFDESVAGADFLTINDLQA